MDQEKFYASFTFGSVKNFYGIFLPWEKICQCRSLPMTLMFPQAKE